MGFMADTNVQSFTTVGSALPVWLSAAPGAATWDGTNLTVTGTATIIGDPLASGDHPVVTDQGTLNITPSSGNQVHIASLSISSGANTLITSTSGTATVLVITSSDGLSIAGASTPTGTLDVANNNVVVANGDFTGITALVKAGYNGNVWNGKGIASSTAAADSTHKAALGVSNFALTGTTIGGVTLGASDLLVGSTAYGDATMDRHVNAADYSRIDVGYAFRSTMTGWANGDFNYDGTTNATDYSLIDATYASGQFTAPTTQAMSAQPSKVKAGVVSLPATSAVIFSQVKIDGGFAEEADLGLSADWDPFGGSTVNP
jgi:hypothetical protein